MVNHDQLRAALNACLTSLETAKPGTPAWDSITASLVESAAYTEKTARLHRLLISNVKVTP